MISTATIYRAPPGSGSLVLGRTLPSLLSQACDRHPNAQALNQWQKRRWQSVSNAEFQTSAEECALGLRSLGLNRGDRVAFVMNSDISFCIADMGCLLAGVVNVPIDLTQTIENILFILQHAEAKALVVSNLDLLAQLTPYLEEAASLQTVIVAEVAEDWNVVRGRVWGREDAQEVEGEHLPPEDECLQIPHLLGDDHTKGEPHLSQVVAAPALPPEIGLLSLDEIRELGRGIWSVSAVERLRDEIAPSDLATILYIASETKRPRGVMLTHENISADILAAFSTYPNLETGDKETALIFLPLTHIFARAFLYGHLAYGHSIYFSDANHVVKHLKTVNPTIMITVPRLLEKVYERILDQGQRLVKFDRAVFYWTLKLAQRYELGKPLQRLYALQLKLASRLVFARWKSIFGDRMKALICGGAALRADIANVLSAAGIPVLQGYGLTETSAVLCYNRGTYNRAGTVGVPIPGVEIAIAEDQEILVKAPFVMQGYYRDPNATAEVLEPDGWLHTGDVGRMTPNGFLEITGVKKPLFKLSTGKYVSPLPLEQELTQSPLVAHAIAVGANHKFCGMLIVPNLEALEAEIQPLGIETSDPSWLYHPCVLGLYQALIDGANCHLPYWSTVRKFKLILAELTVENGLLRLDGTVDRVRALDVFAAEIQSLYMNEVEPQMHTGLEGASSTALVCPTVTGISCPTYAKSLMHY